MQPETVLKELENAFYIYFKLITKKNLKIDEKLSMTHSELEILSVVDKTKNCSITDIARQSDMTLAGASLYVTKLEKKGVVNKNKSPLKKSQAVVTLTRLGKKACKVHAEYHARHNGKILDFLRSLDSDDLQKSNAFAESITQWIESFYEESMKRR